MQRLEGFALNSQYKLRSRSKAFSQVETIDLVSIFRFFVPCLSFIVQVVSCSLVRGAELEDSIIVHLPLYLLDSQLLRAKTEVKKASNRY